MDIKEIATNDASSMRKGTTINISDFAPKVKKLSNHGKKKRKRSGSAEESEDFSDNDEEARKNLAERRKGRKLSQKEIAERQHKKESEALEAEIINLVEAQVVRSETESQQSAMKGGNASKRQSSLKTKKSNTAPMNN
jgi:hypothetical protein